jgi:hypothetical protein
VKRRRRSPDRPDVHASTIIRCYMSNPAKEQHGGNMKRGGRRRMKIRKIQRLRAHAMRLKR